MLLFVVVIVAVVAVVVAVADVIFGLVVRNGAMLSLLLVVRGASQLVL